MTVLRIKRVPVDLPCNDSHESVRIFRAKTFPSHLIRAFWLKTDTI